MKKLKRCKECGQVLGLHKIGAKAKWAKLTKEQRKAHIDKMNKARLKKKLSPVELASKTA